MATLEERVEKVETKTSMMEGIIMRILYIQQENAINISKLEQGLNELKNEMKEFKDEMKEFKDEMKGFKDEMKDFKDETEKVIKELKNSVKELKDEHKRMNKQWGDLSNKLGTIVEDIIFPATRPVLEKYFKCEINFIAPNIRKKIDDFSDEFDVVAISNKCKTIFLIEVKSTIREFHIVERFPKKIESFKRLFPEYESYKIVPVIASLTISEDKVNLASKHKIYAMAYREWEYMDLLNFDEVSM